MATFSAENILTNFFFFFFFFFFFQKTDFDILSPVDTIFMKCLILFSGKNKKNISKGCLLKSLFSVLSINGSGCTFKGSSSSKIAAVQADLNV